jgi:hypothetical protein
MKTDKFKESLKRFEKQTEETRQSCLWQIFPPKSNFMLECWQMQDGSVKIFQIFDNGHGYMTYNQELV